MLADLQILINIITLPNTRSERSYGQITRVSQGTSWRQCDLRYIRTHTQTHTHKTVVNKFLWNRRIFHYFFVILNHFTSSIKMFEIFFFSFFFFFLNFRLKFELPKIKQFVIGNFFSFLLRILFTSYYLKCIHLFSLAFSFAYDILPFLLHFQP